MSAKSAHTAAAQRVRAGINSMRVRFRMILGGAKRLHVYAIRILPSDRIVVACPVFAQVVDASCGVPEQRARVSLDNK